MNEKITLSERSGLEKIQEEEEEDAISRISLQNTREVNFFESLNQKSDKDIKKELKKECFLQIKKSDLLSNQNS